MLRRVPPRMRVTIKNGSAPSPCGSYDRGETEDYTVVITTPFAGQTNLSSEIMDDTPVSVQYFPNPFTDKITLELQPSSSPSQVFIYDIAGKMQFTAEWSEWRNEIDMSGFNSGDLSGSCDARG
jgi:lysyl endopeptidase